MLAFLISLSFFFEIVFVCTKKNCLGGIRNALLLCEDEVNTDDWEKTFATDYHVSDRTQAYSMTNAVTFVRKYER